MANNLYVAAYDSTTTATWDRANLSNGRNGFSSTGYITSTVDTDVRTDSGDETGTLPQFQTSTPYKLWAIADDGTTSSSLVSSSTYYSDGLPALPALVADTDSITDTTARPRVQVQW